LQNAHAYVNAAFLARISPADLSVSEKPRMAFGGVSSSFVRASATEDLVVGKRINDAAALANVLKKLKTEVVPDKDPAMASPEYRIHLVQALFYKVF
jgi:xanthine dehydrogenase/oxidase